MTGPNGAGTGNGHAGPAGQPNGHDISTPLRIDDREPSLPPYNSECEYRVLGTLLATNKAYSRIAAVLRPEHFGNALNGRVYEAIAAQIKSGAVANPITLRHLFEHDPTLTEIGAEKYLRQLFDAAIDERNIDSYAAVVVDLWRCREADIAYNDYRATRWRIGDGNDLIRLHSRIEEILHDDQDLRPISPTAWSGPAPQRQWMVPYWIPLRRATGLYGIPGSGKTTVTQTLCSAAALDPVKFPHASWLGQPVRKCRSVLFYCEDDEDEMHFRQEQINRLYQCTNDDLGDMLCLPLLGEDGTLMTFDRDGRGTVTPLFYTLLRIVKQHRAQLVVLDTLSDVFGGNELNRSHARQFVQQGPARIARDCNCGIICCAHPSLTGITSKSGISGSTGWPGAFRSHLYLHPLDVEPDEVADTDERMLTRKKSNWAKAGETIEMRWSDGVFIHKPQPTGIIGWIGRGHVDRVFLKLFDDMSEQKRWVSANSAARNYAPRQFGKLSKDARESFKEKDFAQAMERLLGGSKPTLRVEQYGRPSQPQYRLARVKEGQHC